MPMFIFALLACSVDLPDDWKGGEPVESIVQTSCKGSPYEDYNEYVTGNLNPPVDLEVYHSLFRCEQDVEAFYVDDGATLKVLLQPEDMNPKIIPDCDCLFNFKITVGAEESRETVEVYRRWDNLNEGSEGSEPVLIGELSSLIID